MKTLFTISTLLLATLIFSASNLTAVTLIDEDFEAWPAAGWQVVDHNGNGSWTNHNAIHAWDNYINKDKPWDEKGDVAVADGHDDDIIDTSLIAPPLDLTDNSYIVLYYETVYSDAHWMDDYVDIDVSTNGGSDWITVLHWEDVDVVQHGPGTNVVVNISVAAGCPNALVRFHYYSPAGGYWWEIDNVKIIADTVNPADFMVEAVAKNQIDLSWMTNEVGDEVIIARNLSDSFGTPEIGKVYNLGENIGSSSVIYKGNETEHSNSNLVSEATEYFYKIWSVNSKTQYSDGVSANATSCIGTFPYMESFESDIGGWLNIKDNDFDWRRHSGTTVSSLTGPNNGANGSPYYIYTEATNPGNPFKPFLIETSFDFITSPNPELAFFYHMYGEEMGRLHVDVCDDSGNWHSNLWEISGQQQTSSADPWKQAIVEMQQFGGQSPVKIRFRGVTGDGNIGDMAVDYITISNRPGGLIFTPPNQSKSGNFGTTVQYEINALNLIGVGSDFNLTYTGFGGGSGWNEVGPANTSFINYRTSTNIIVSVTIDSNAIANEAHTSTVTSVSTDGIFTNSATIITKCDWNYEIYYEGFSSWQNGWTNYYLGKVVGGWYHYLANNCGHDLHEGATNWFVSPGINLDSVANQIYLSFYFAHETTYVMDHKQSIYVSIGSRNPKDGDFVKIDDIDYIPNSVDWLYNSYDLSAFRSYSNVYIAIDYSSWNPMIVFDEVFIYGNKTGVKNAKLVSPTSFSIDSYQSTPAITGSIAIAGSTGISGPATQVTAQFGYGLRNTYPYNNQEWIWVDAVYTHSDTTCDYYNTSGLVTLAGKLDYAFRFKNGESAWIYADTDGSSNGYSKTSAGKMTVALPELKGSLAYLQKLENYSATITISFVNDNNDISIVADDFTLTLDTKIKTIRWNGRYASNGSRDGAEKGFQIDFYDDNGGLPGNLLYSEFVNGYASEMITNDIYCYQVNLSNDFFASADSTYWFSVHNVCSGSSHWGIAYTSGSNRGNLPAVLSPYLLDNSNWHSGYITTDYGFEFYGSQEPLLSVVTTQDFGSVEMYVTSSVPLIVGNAGGGVLTGTVQNLASPFFVSGDSNYFIQASSNITLNTYFVSDVEGNFSQNVVLSGGGGKTVVFKGNAIPEPSIFLIFNLLVFYWHRKLIFIK